MIDRASLREQAAYAAGVNARGKDEAVYRSDIGARVRAGGPIKVLRRGQHEIEPEWSADDQAKLQLYRAAANARRAVKARIQAWPGTFAGAELWSRFQGLENYVKALGARGLWRQALSEFQSQVTALLAARPVPRDAEPMGMLGVGDACAEDCLGCVACRGRHAREDFWLLLGRARAAFERGDVGEADRMLSRAKQAVLALEPQDLSKAQAALEKTRTTVSAQINDFEGIADGPLIVATSEQQRVFERQANQLFARSREKQESGSDLRAQVTQALAELSKFQAWEGGWITGESSSVIRARLQQALVNMKSGEGWRPQEKRFEDVSVAKETVKALPGEVKKRAGELTRLWGPCVTAMIEGSFVKGWNCLSTPMKVGTVVATGLLSYGVLRRVRG